MIKEKIETQISILREVLADSILTSADLVAIRNQIGELQDELARLVHED